jgi:membrane fusion protein, heavy metal efflux system
MTNPGYLSLSSRSITIQLRIVALVCALAAGTGGCSDTSRAEDGRAAGGGGGGGGGGGETAAAPASTASTTNNGVSLSPEEQRAGSITVGPPVAKQTAREVTASAVLHMDDTRTSRVGAVVEGVVVDTHAQVGDRVTRGARLAALHSHTVHEAWASHRRALADVRRTTNELAFAKDAESRAQRLLAAKAASQQEAQRAQTDRAAAEETLIIARSEVQRARDELEHLGIHPQSGDAAAGGDDDARETIPVIAPANGVVIERLITPGTAVTPGTPL